MKLFRISYASWSKIVDDALYSVQPFYLNFSFDVHCFSLLELHTVNKLRFYFQVSMKNKNGRLTHFNACWGLFVGCSLHCQGSQKPLWCQMASPLHSIPRNYHQWLPTCIFYHNFLRKCTYLFTKALNLIYFVGIYIYMCICKIISEQSVLSRTKIMWMLPMRYCIFYSSLRAHKQIGFRKDRCSVIYKKFPTFVHMYYFYTYI